MTLLSTVQEVAGEIGTVVPASLIGASDPNATRLLAAAKAAGQALYRARDWSTLEREYTFTTVSGTDNYGVPEDWGRQITNTAWDRDQYHKMRGSMPSSEWQVSRSGLVSSAAKRFRYRLIVGQLTGSILLDPIPTGAYDLVIEYISWNWCENAAGVGKPTFTADTDLIRVDEELFRMSVLWRMLRSLGLPYADQKYDYEVALRSARKADMAMGTVHLGGRPTTGRPWANLPEGSWGV